MGAGGRGGHDYHKERGKGEAGRKKIIVSFTLSSLTVFAVQCYMHLIVTCADVVD